MVDTLEANRVHTLSVDATETIAIWKIGGGSISRTATATTYIDTPENIDIRVDVGIRPQGADRPTQESDLTWFNSLVSKTASSSGSVREQNEIATGYLRLVVTTAASANTTAEVATAVGRV